MKELVRFCGIVALVGLLHIGSAEAIGLSVTPSAQIVDLGDSTSVDIVVSDLGDEIVGAYDLDILYDPSIVMATGVGFGPHLGDSISFFDIFTPGLVDLFELSWLSDDELAANQPDTFTLATIFFDTVSVGTSPVTLIAMDSPFNDVKGRNANELDLDVTDGSITVVQNVNPVPEPGTIALFGSGLVGMLGYGWYRRKEEDE